MGQALDKLSGPSKAEAAAFVSNHSPEPQDLLPGLCLLTERWLEKVSSAPALAASAWSSSAYSLSALHTRWQRSRCLSFWPHCRLKAATVLERLQLGYQLFCASSSVCLQTLNRDVFKNPLTLPCKLLLKIVVDVGKEQGCVNVVACC